ncbi:MAG: hypothetical protein P8X74_14525 [Reinekea sp.]
MSTFIILGLTSITLSLLLAIKPKPIRGTEVFIYPIWIRLMTLGPLGAAIYGAVDFFSEPYEIYLFIAFEGLMLTLFPAMKSYWNKYQLMVRMLRMKSSDLRQKIRLGLVGD